MKKNIKYLSVFLIFSLFFIGNVSAGKGKYNFSCGYVDKPNSRKAEKYVITYQTDGDLIEMTSCKHIPNTNVNNQEDCSEYKFNSKGHVLKDSSWCPGSINVDKKNKKITWITNFKGKYVNNTIDKSNVENLGTVSSCTSFTTKNSCINSTNPKCVWNSEHKMCSVNGNAYLSCGDAKDIPPVVPELMSYAVNLLKIVTPIILIIVGIIELVKAVASTNEDSMKKAQSKLIKKVIAAVMVFFVITIVQFIILKVADSSDAGSIKSCLKCFLNGTDDCDSIYVKDGYGTCYFTDGSSKSCDSIVETE